MRDPKRIDIFCEELKKMWKRAPDQRFGQLMCNFMGHVSSETGTDIWFIEDNEMQKFVKDFYVIKKEGTK